MKKRHVDELTQERDLKRAEIDDLNQQITKAKSKLANLNGLRRAAKRTMDEEDNKKALDKEWARVQTEQQRLETEWLGLEDYRSKTTEEMEKVKEQIVQKGEELAQSEIRRIEMMDMMSALQISIMDMTQERNRVQGNIDQLKQVYEEREIEEQNLMEQRLQKYRVKLNEEQKINEEMEKYLEAIHQVNQEAYKRLSYCKDRFLTFNVSGERFTVPYQFCRNFPALLYLWENRDSIETDSTGAPYLMIPRFVFPMLLDWFYSDRLCITDTEQGIALIKEIIRFGNIAYIDGNLVSRTRDGTKTSLYQRLSDKISRDFKTQLLRQGPFPEMKMIYVIKFSQPSDITMIKDGRRYRYKVTMIVFSGVPKQNAVRGSYSYRFEDASLVMGDNKENAPHHGVTEVIVPPHTLHLHRRSYFPIKDGLVADLTSCFIMAWDQLVLGTQEGHCFFLYSYETDNPIFGDRDISFGTSRDLMMGEDESEFFSKKGLSNHHVPGLDGDADQRLPESFKRKPEMSKPRFKPPKVSYYSGRSRGPENVYSSSVTGSIRVPPPRPPSLRRYGVAQERVSNDAVYVGHMGEISSKKKSKKSKIKGADWDRPYLPRRLNSYEKVGWAREEDVVPVKDALKKETFSESDSGSRMAEEMVSIEDESVGSGCEVTDTDDESVIIPRPENTGIVNMENSEDEEISFSNYMAKDVANRFGGEVEFVVEDSVSKPSLHEWEAEIFSQEREQYRMDPNPYELRDSEKRERVISRPRRNAVASIDFAEVRRAMNEIEPQRHEPELFVETDSDADEQPIMKKG